MSRSRYAGHQCGSTCIAAAARARSDENTGLRISQYLDQVRAFARRQPSVTRNFRFRKRRNLADVDLARRLRKIVATLQVEPEIRTVAAQLADPLRDRWRYRLALVEDAIERLA